MSQLKTLDEKVLPQAIKNDLVAYCPAMDLIAVATIDEQVHVFRLNGQKVFGVPNKKPECEITHLQWKPNGRLLAIALSDYSVSIINAHTTKAVHTFQYAPEARTQISCLAWGVCFTDPAYVDKHINGTKTEVTLDDVLSRGLQGLQVDLPQDLPTELANLEIESSLPKLSLLPLGSKDDELFSSRVSIDSLFHTYDKETNESTDILIAGGENGALRMNVYDSFDLGSFDARQAHPQVSLSKHASHPYFSTQALLFKGSGPSMESLILTPLDLRMISETGTYLPLIASKSTQLQNLLRYLAATQDQIYKEFKSSQDLPRRFMANIEETLQEKIQCDFKSAAYHLVATGHCYEYMREWLVDELRDTGQKRWDKATNTGYENLQRLIHENFLPALQRLSIAVSRLRGLSRFEESRVALDLDTLELDRIFDTISCLQLLCHTTLMYIGSELRQFTAFSSWLRQEIETQATDPASSGTDESADKEGVPDYPQIFDYIQGALQNSQLYRLLNLTRIGSEAQKPETVGDDILVYDRFKEAMRKVRQGKPSETQALGLEALMLRLQRQCEVVLRRTAAAQGRRVRFGESIVVGRGMGPLDMRALSKSSSQSDIMSVYVAAGRKDVDSSICVRRVDWRITSGMSSLVEDATASVLLPPDSEIRDLKFVDDTNVLILLANKVDTILISIPFRDESENGKLSYATTSVTSSKSARMPTLSLSSSGSLSSFIVHTFRSEVWQPGSLEVNGRKGRRALCVVSEDKLRYLLLDLDGDNPNSYREGADDGGSEEGDEEEGSEMEM